MTTRRSRPSRSRKSQTPVTEAPHDDVLVETAVRLDAKYASHASHAPPMPPSLADELALVDAGWD